MATKTKDIVTQRGRRGPATKFNEKQWETILDLISRGQSLRSICERKDMPSLKTVRLWLRDTEELVPQYARARDEQADYYADRLVEIAENVPADKDQIEKAKLLSDNIKWVASKLKPKKYGDKLDLTSDGEQLPTPITALQINMPGSEARQLPAPDNRTINSYY